MARMPSVVNGKHRCWKCALYLEPTYFSKNSAKRNGISDTCKGCSRDYNKVYQIQNKDGLKIKAEQRTIKYESAFVCYPFLKKCPKCKMYKLSNEFQRDKRRLCGLFSWCRTCSQSLPRSEEEKHAARDRSSEWYYDNPERVRDRDYIKKYGITIEDFDEMVALQESKCLICKRLSEKLCVDHCHNTGKVRALLCKACNGMLGHFERDPHRLDSFKSYLESKVFSLL